MVYKVYLRFTSPSRGRLRPILFDKAYTVKGAEGLIKTAQQELDSQTEVFVGQRCNKCKTVFKTDELRSGFCAGCENDMCEQDREEPNGGAYREHQFS